MDDNILNDLEKALKSVNRFKVEKILKELLKIEGSTFVADRIISKVLERIGRGWEEGVISLSQVYMSGKICEEFIEREISHENFSYRKSPHIAIAVLEDYHLLGKRILYSILKTAGYKISDYGSMTSEDLVERAISDKVEILLISVLMLPSALRVKDVRAKFAEKGYDIKIVVGGAPFNFDSELWREVGADMMGKNASDALEILEKVFGGDI